MTQLKTYFLIGTLTGLFFGCEKALEEVSPETSITTSSIAAKSQCTGCVDYEAGLQDEERQLLALKFAPQLRFDRAARTFPQSAGTIFWNSAGRSEDNCSGRLYDNGISDSFYDGNAKDRKPHIRTYYTIINDSSDSHYFISYWWAYWRQPNCFGRSGGHDYDWEHITLKIRMLGEVPIGAYYAQHSGGETYNWSQLERMDNHPIVYVGKKAHPSYKNRSRFEIPCATDYANPNGEKDHFSVWDAPGRLIELRCDYKWAAFSGDWGKPGPGPLQRAYDIW